MASRTSFIHGATAFGVGMNLVLGATNQVSWPRERGSWHHPTRSCTPRTRFIPTPSVVHPYTHRGSSQHPSRSRGHKTRWVSSGTSIGRRPNGVGVPTHRVRGATERGGCAHPSRSKSDRTWWVGTPSALEERRDVGGGHTQRARGATKRGGWAHPPRSRPDRARWVPPRTPVAPDETPCPAESPRSVRAML